MEEDNGLELSLGLSFGGSSGKGKTKDISSDPKFEEGGSSSKVAGGNANASDVSFKSLFQTNEHNGKKAVSQSNENFWTDLGKRSVPAPNNSDNLQNQSQFIRYQELWSANNNKVNVMEEEKSVSKKRQLPTDEISFQKRHEKVSDHAEAVGKGPAGVTLVKKSHVSVNTEDDSSGENEDVAESEAEGSNSWMVPQREDSAKCSSISRSTDKHVSNDLNGAGLQPQKQQSYSAAESNYEQGKVAYGIPLSLQPVTVMTVPYPVPVKVPASAATTSNSAGFPSTCVMQLMPVTNGERPIVPALNTNSVQVAFGYSPVQLPTLETNSSWVFGSQPQKVSSTGNGAPSPQQHQDDSKRTHVSLQMPSTSALVFDGKTPDLGKDMSKHATETGASSSSHGEEESKGTNTSYKPKETPSQSIVEGLPHELSVIRPGIASNVKFGGSGSYPDLPWVSTTGPNGKTISGVTYKYNKNQIKIVCACHGTHMSPEEFIQHANTDESNPENNSSPALFATNNPAASAQN